jgi:isoamylase
MNSSDTGPGAMIDPTPRPPRLESGTPQLLGANWTGRGTNFAVFSAHAERIDLCLYDETGTSESRATRVACAYR